MGAATTPPEADSGVRGAAFIKREYETRPFIMRYFLPQRPFVGVRCGFDNHLRPLDFNDYGDGELTDQEFCEAYNSRDPASVAGNETVNTVNAESA
jgi:hypothetical protein